MKIIARTQYPLSLKSWAHSNVEWRNQPLKSPLCWVEIWAAFLQSALSANC